MRSKASMQRIHNAFYSTYFALGIKHVQHSNMFEVLRWYKLTKNIADCLYDTNSMLKYKAYVEFYKSFVVMGQTAEAILLYDKLNSALFWHSRT